VFACYRFLCFHMIMYLDSKTVILKRTILLNVSFVLWSFSYQQITRLNHFLHLSVTLLHRIHPLRNAKEVQTNFYLHLVPSNDIWIYISGVIVSKYIRRTIMWAHTKHSVYMHTVQIFHDLDVFPIGHIFASLNMIFGNQVRIRYEFIETSVSNVH
jgi:hypothetical protein